MLDRTTYVGADRDSIPPEAPVLLPNSGGGAARRLSSTTMRSRPLVRSTVLIVLAFMIGVGALVPLFKWNIVGTADGNFFQNWDRFSESLVLAKIESTTPGAAEPGTDRAGLLIADPDAGEVFENFDGLKTGGHSTAHGYVSYISNLGLQGFVFNGLYNAGCTSVGCLETVNAGFTAAALVGFALLLCRVAPRSFAIVFLLTAAGSPWIVSSARNLYWVPSTWLLPACAAVFFVTARGRRNRVIAGCAVLSLFMLRFGTGFEYITSVALLAASIPVLALVFKRAHDLTVRKTLRDSGIIFGLGIIAFVVILFFLVLDVGNGDLGAGARYVWGDATKRTYGGVSDDPNTALSLAVSPSVVIFRYLFGWATDVISIGAGTPFAIVLGPRSLWLLIVVATVAAGVRYWRGQETWRRDCALVLIALSIPMSWYILAKAHSFIHTPMNFVLWYLLGVSTLIWIAGRWAVDIVFEGIGQVGRHRRELSRARSFEEESTG